MIGDSNDKTNFPHKLLLTDTQVSKFCKAFANNSSASIKSWHTQLSKLVQSEGFLDRILGLLLKADLPLMKNVLKGTVMKIEKALISDCLRVSKVSWKSSIPTIYNFAVIHPWNLLFS